ncbi:MAG: hypothetical protein GY810_32035 [Aureispira sp.]|nr:hypothetical protein [Aureispira sp.]
MTASIFKTLRIIELLVHAVVPSFAMYVVHQHTQVSTVFLTFSLFTVLMIWSVIYVLLQQKQYPNDLLKAFIYTGFTVLNIVVISLLSSITFFFYLYFISTLIVLTLLLLLGTLSILRSKKEVSGKLWLAIFMLISMGLTAGYTLWISNPFTSYIITLNNNQLILFAIPFIVQILKLTFVQARYMISETPNEESVYPLSKVLRLIVLLLAILMSGIVIFLFP